MIAGPGRRSAFANVGLSPDPFPKIEHDGSGSRGASMWVVSLRRLREFWAVHPRAEVPLRGWFTVASAAEWQTFNDLRTTFPTADLVGNCTVFNIGGNSYRLIARVFFRSHKVYAPRVMTHAECDRENWPTHCGCHSGPTDRIRPVRGKPRKKKAPTRRRRKT